jgi:hypothetical protein
MPHDPIRVRQDVLEKETHGGNDRVILTDYEAPAKSDTEVADDPYRASDAAIAANMMKWLNREYPGHLWGVVSDQAQGIVKFNIPILMGFDMWWTINLRTTDIIEGMKAGAGQILERYRLTRGRFVLSEFLEAREKHSRLVVGSRPVPE